MRCTECTQHPCHAGLHPHCTLWLLSLGVLESVRVRGAEQCGALLCCSSSVVGSGSVLMTRPRLEHTSVLPAQLWHAERHVARLDPLHAERGAGGGQPGLALRRH